MLDLGFRVSGLVSTEFVEAGVRFSALGISFGFRHYV